MKKGLSIFTAILTSMSSCVKIETANLTEDCNSILEYVTDSKNTFSHILLGPIKIYPWTWVNTDAECYVQIDNNRLLIVNRLEPYNTTSKQKYNTVVLNYNSKEDILNDFKKIIEIGNTGTTGDMKLSAVSAELISSSASEKRMLCTNNISVHLTDDSVNDFYYFTFNAVNSFDGREKEFIIIPADFL